MRTNQCVILSITVEIIHLAISENVAVESEENYFYHFLDEYNESTDNSKQTINYPNLNDVKKEAFIIGVDKPFPPQTSKLERDLENLFGKNFFEKNKFQLFFGLLVITACLVASCLAYICCKTLKTWKRRPGRSLRPLSFTDRFLESAGVPQETFQFMPLKALSPVHAEFEFEEDELPDYSQLQKKTIFPDILDGT